MEEPSVLDYVKSKLAFWKHSSIQIPAPEQEAAVPAPGADDLGETAGQEPANAMGAMIYSAQAPAKTRPALRFSAAGLLLTLSSLVLALIAQGFLEPPNREVPLSIFCYAFSAVLLGAAYFRNYLQPAPLEPDKAAQDPYTFRWEGVAVGLVAMVLAFLLFGKGAGDVPEFNFLNTALWVLSIGYLVFAFRLPRAQPELRDRLARLLRMPAWNVRLTRWGLLVLLVTAMVLFFRFYRLSEVPAEMVSDHAEKLLDVYDVLNGEFRVFFPRNTGREAFQFYWTALMVRLFDTGISFMALKLGTVLGGLLALFYTYRLGNEIGGRWVALFALAFTGFSYWANIQSRIGLRFPLYPMFLAPMLFYLIRGLRLANRNDLIWAGLWLGAGLHGYTAFRIVPVLVVVAVALYLLHHPPTEMRKFALWGLILVALFSLAVFLPLFRFTLERPDLVAFRSLTRLGDLERPLPGPAWLIFLKNTWNALVMFFWNNGDVWVHSIPYRPALDVISAALFFLGLVLVFLRYLRRRNWIDLFLLVSIPILLMPSILSLAFPNENPNLNRTAGAYIPVFLILATGLEALLRGLRRSLPGRLGSACVVGLGLMLVTLSASANFRLVFKEYDEIVRHSSWNSSEMGAVIRDFDEAFGRQEDAWVVAYPYWVDTRLVGMNAGFPTRDTAITPDRFAETVENPRAKLFIVNPQDTEGLSQLRLVYPQGKYWLYSSRTPGKDFIVFMVPPGENSLP